MTAEARPAPTTFYREIDRNRRRSWLLVAVVIVLLGLLGGAIGYATGFGWRGVVFAVILATAMSIGSFYAGGALAPAPGGPRRPGATGAAHRRGAPGRRAATDLAGPASGRAERPRPRPGGEPGADR